MSMCPLDNNIIAFGVPVSADQQAADDAVAAIGDNAGSGSGLSSAGRTARAQQLIELVNFAQSSRIQTLVTRHEQPMFFLDYSPDSEQLLSCSPDTVQIWYKESGLETNRGPGALDERPERTVRQPQGTLLRIAKVHPAWTSVLLATNEALEVRELRRGHGESTPQLAGREPVEPPLGLKWRREGMQVTAAAFIAQGNMLVVSDRGDRLLLLNYHGLHAARRCVLPWAEPSYGLTLGTPSGEDGSGLDGIGSAGNGPQNDPDLQAHEQLPPPAPSSSSSNGGGERGEMGERSGRGGVCTVTSVVECPDVVGRCSEEWRSGISQLAVSSSRGDVLLVKL